MDDKALDRLGAGKYLLITSYRKNGTGVATPVWVVRDGDALGAWSAADSWKVKRIRRNPAVTMASCTLRGEPLGPALPGRAEIVDGAATERIRDVLRRKYGLIGRLSMIGSRLRRGRDGSVGLRVTLEKH